MFLNIAGYKFEPLNGLDSLIPSFQNKCDELDLRGSIYLSPNGICLLYTSPSPRDKRQSRMPSSA